MQKFVAIYSQSLNTEHHNSNVHQLINGYTVVHSYNGILLSNNERIIDTCNKMYVAQKQYAKWKKSVSKVPCCIISYIFMCLVTQSCFTLCDPTDYSPPGSSVREYSLDKNTRVGCHALLQGIFPTQVSRITGGFFITWATREAQEYWNGYLIPFSRASSQPRNRTGVSWIAGGLFTSWATREAPNGVIRVAS